MSMNDTISDLLTRIRNGQMSQKKSVTAPYSKMKEAMCKVMQDEGYIDGYSIDDDKIRNIKVELKYYEGKPVISEIKRVSTPGRRVYSSISDLPRTYNGLGISILSTPRGVMSDNEARAAHVGGEVLCQVF